MPIPIASAAHPSQDPNARLERDATPAATRKPPIAAQLITKIPFESPKRILAPVASTSWCLNLSANLMPSSASQRTLNTAVASKTRMDGTFERSSSALNLSARTAPNTTNPNKPRTPSSSSVKGSSDSDLAYARKAFEEALKAGSETEWDSGINTIRIANETKNTMPPTPPTRVQEPFFNSPTHPFG